MNFKDFKKSIEEKLFFPFIDFLVFSNLWIAVAATSIFLAMSSLIEEGLSQTYYLAIQIFGATLFTYNFLRYKSLNHHSFKKSPIAIWMNKHLTLIRVFMIIGLLMVIAPLTFFSFSINTLIVIALLILFSIAYLPLRKFWWAKVLIVAIVWSIMSVLLPISLINNLEIRTTIFLFSAFLSFYVAITLPFEIRDMKYDREENSIVTFALKFGIKVTKVISSFFLVLSMILFFLIDFQIGFAFSIVYVFAQILVIKCKEESSEYTFTFLFDGLIIVFAISLLYFKYYF